MVGNSKRPLQQGFTLVELVCVLVILGVLGAVALPRFMGMAAGAHRSVVSGTSNAFRTALQLANLACVVQNWRGRDNLPGYGNGNVDFNATCYPSDTTGNANTIANNPTRCVRVWNAILEVAPTITAAGSGADYRARANNQVCTYLYLRDESGTRQFTYNSSNGLIVLINP